jgi:exodeoxyribonuclease X
MSILRIIDFETTGLAPPAEVIEVGLCDFDTTTREITPLLDYYCRADIIPPEARAVHHIFPEDVVHFSPFDANKEIERAKEDGVAAFVAHNADFESQWLPSDIPFICTYKAALRMLDFAPLHSNFGLGYWLMDHGLIDVSRDLISPAHRAMPDAVMTAHLLRLLISEGATIAELIQWTGEPRLLPTCPIGQWRGSPWSDVDIGFLNWMLSKDDMEADLKWNARKEVEKRTVA